MSDTVIDMRDRLRAKVAATDTIADDATHLLQNGDGGGTSPPMVPLKDYVDKANEAVETRLTARLDKLATKGTVWGAVGTVLGILLAVLALVTNRFDSGMSTRSALDSVMSDQHQRDDRQDRKLNEILRRLPSPTK